jgi:hypothetical protein
LLWYSGGLNIGRYLEAKFYKKDDGNLGGMFVFLYYTDSDGKCFWTDWHKILKFFAFFELLAQKTLNSFE